ncbi:hypothetical protein QTP88_024860 [Uroleucon formosanum]
MFKMLSGSWPWESDSSDDEALTRSRNIVENTFGILANTWRVYHSPLKCRIKLADKVILATIVLHNYTRQLTTQTNLATVEEQTNETNLFISIRIGTSSNSSREALNVQNLLKEYFISNEGRVEWQQRIATMTTARGALQRVADRGSTGTVLSTEQEENALGLDGDYYGMQQRKQPARDQDQGETSRRRVWKSAYSGEPQTQKCYPRLWNRTMCSFCGHGVGRAVRTRKLAIADRDAGGTYRTR